MPRKRNQDARRREVAMHVRRTREVEQALVLDQRGDLRDVTYLSGEVRRHRVHRVRQILPGTGYAAYLRLATEFAFGTDLACDARDLRSERVELIDHRVDRIFQLENLTANIDRNLTGKVTVGDGGSDFGDVTDLRGER